MIDEFIRLALHRRKVSQHKAEEIWREIKPKLPPGVAHMIIVEWSHYNNGELTTEEFGKTLKEALSK